MSPSTLISLLQQRAGEAPHQRAYTFLEDDGSERHLTHGELHQRACLIAAALRARARPGERALLLFAPGLEYIEALFGCLYAGVLAVPAYPPDVMRLQRTLPRLQAIAQDSGASLVLTTQGIHLLAGELIAQAAPEMARLGWISTDALEGSPDTAAAPPPGDVTPGTLAFLQYTSGSTGSPKGVMLSHANLMHNCALIHRAFEHGPDSRGVIWLPPYHDMGLIGGILQPLYAAFPTVLMSPLGFLSRPVRWLEAVSTHRATTSGGPNFAFDLCVRKTTPEQRAALDLSSWRVAFSGAEPIRSDTIERFVEAFGPSGFRREAFYPCYGLAEATLIVSGGRVAAPPVVAHLDADAAALGHVADASSGGRAPLATVGCGEPLPGLEVRIVEPQSRQPCPPDRVGEIWVRGGSVAQGYWGQPGASEEMFQARLATGEDSGAFLRTGDLGFLRGGELFVSGRLKDLLIIRGRNHYPQDIERTVERSHPALRPGCGAAFPVEVDGEERLVVVQELDPRQAAEPEPVLACILEAVTATHEVRPHEVLLLKPGSLPKTSSGKVQRRACRALHARGELEVLASSAHAPEPVPDAEAAPRGDLEQQLGALVADCLRLEPGRLDRRAALTTLGLDSLSAVELQARVEARFGVALSLGALLDGPSLGVLAERLETARRAPPRHLPPSARSVPSQAEEHPLSPNQQALWFLQHLDPSSPVHNVATAVRLRGTLSIPALREAFRRLVERHPALRTTFASVSHAPVARVASTAPVDFVEQDASGWSEAEREQFLAREARRPFDLERGPLMRMRLLRQDADTSLLVLSLHHLVIDFWSMGLLAREMRALYAAARAGTSDALPAPPLSFADYVHWEQRLLAGPEGERHRQYWEQRLAGEPQVLELPTDRPRPAAASFAMHSARVRVGPEVTGRLRRLALREGATLHALVLAAYQTLLSRWSGQEQLCVGLYSAGRGRAGLESLVGYLVNPMVLPGDLRGAPPFTALLGQTHRALLEALEHQPYPFVKLVEHFQPRRDASRAPLFQAALTWQRTPGDARESLTSFNLGGEGSRLNWSELVLESLPPLPRYQEGDAWLELGEVGEELRGLLSLRADLFDASTAERLATHLGTLLAGIAEAPERPVTALPLLTPAEREHVLHAWNPPRPAAAPSPSGPCLHQLFEAQVQRTPDALALSCEGRRLTYAELNRRANQVAHRLVELGVRPGDSVGLSVERSLELGVALLGILKAGAAYLPVDPLAPRERVAWMVEDARPVLFVAHASLASRLPESTRCLLLDEAHEALERQPGHDPDVPVTPGLLTYVIYTSGTTGRPKGVMVTHSNVTRLLRMVEAELQLDTHVVSTLFHSISFDMSVLELWGALLYGGRVVVVPQDVSRDPARFHALLREERVTFMSQTPSAFRSLLSAERERGGAEQLSLRTLVLGGEKLEVSLLRPWFEAHGDERPRVFNMYGPTEITVYNTLRRMRAEDLVHGRSLLGESLADMWLYLLDAHLEPVPVGFAGEIHVGGAGVTVGYLRRPELTAQRYLADPFRPGDGGRLYRTGDLARRLPGGELEYLHRLDKQIKLRGFRIELGEIEAVLAEQPPVKEAVVHVREDVPGSPALVAYVVLRAGAALEPAELRRALGTRLPEYMLPSTFVALEALPLNTSGKLDRRALPVPTVAPALEGLQAPRTALEAELATLWAELLRVERVGVEDSFFDLGGHSLLATQLISRVREHFAVEVPLRALFEEPTVEGLARHVAQARAPQWGEEPPRIERIAREQPLALSFAQQRMWFLDQLAPASASYHVTGALRLEGPLEPEILRRALQEVVRRHESLRTTFPTVAGKPTQVIHASAAWELPVVELGALPEAVRRAEVERQARAEAHRPFDLSTGPLLRARLLRLSAREHVLVVSMHHIISDGWSIEVLAREAATLYAAFGAGGPSPLAEPTIQYVDYAAWQREWLRGLELQRQLDWWKEQLAGAPPVLELPTDRPRPPIQGFRGAREPVELSPALADALRALSRSEGATLFMTLMAAFQALLGRYAHQRDVVVGTPIANRTRVETEPLIGFFANTLALRADLSSAGSFRALLAQVKRTALGAFAHQDVPFERLVEELQPTRSLGHAPVVQVMFALEEPVRSLALSGLTLTRLALEDGTAKFELMLTLENTGTGLTGAFEYNTDLFDADTVRRMAGHFVTLLEGVCAHPERPVEEVPLLDAAERTRVLQLGQAGPERPEPAVCLSTLFEAQAARTPEALAVLHGEHTLTYRELNARANQLARLLRERGVGAEDRVGLCLERSPGLVVALLGVLKAGAAYVPLDPSYPRERLRWLAGDARPRVLITSTALADGEPEEPGARIDLEREGERLAAYPAENLGLPLSAEGLAYVLYTSGSTGQPKGVMVTHAALHNHMRWMQREFPLREGDRVLQRTPISFDASVWEFHAPLLAGATLVLGGPDAHRDPADILATVQRHRVSTLQLVPTLLEALLETPGVGACPSLQRVFCGGEALLPTTVERFATRLPTARLINLYGPTEATIDASFHVCAPGQARRVPIGRPIDHTRLYVLDEHLEPTPVGVPGELYIGGEGLGRGYLGQAALTAERFVPAPFGTSPGARLYRTGDLALFRPDGQLEYLGRRDQQVKLRGVRIELPEIEATLARHPQVRRAVVGLSSVATGEATGPRLVAHVEAEGTDAAGLRAFLAARLPPAMVPSAYVLLEALPRLPNGKVDRRALPPPEAAVPAGASAEPRDDTEAFLARVWAEVLGVPRVGIHDDFFALGGHSLLATQVMSRAREHFQRELPLRLLFEAPTVARLAEAMGPRAPSAPPPAAPVPASTLLEQVDEMTPEQLDRLLEELDAPETTP